MNKLALVAALPLLLAIPPLRGALESRMALHMLVEFPLLLTAGIGAGLWISDRLPRTATGLARVDSHGLLGITWLLGTSALWMVPTALDLSLLDPTVGALKLASWWIAGLLLAQGWQRASPGILIFGFGNLAWMCASAGLLYQTLESRLCVSYLQDEQVRTGTGLVGLSVALIAWLCWRSWLLVPVRSE